MEAVDGWFQDQGRWGDEARALRAVLREFGLDEALKWGKPTYVHHAANVVQIQPMKEALMLLFFKGALLEDDGTLEWPGPNSRIGKRMRFASLVDLATQEAALRAHVTRAMALAEAGAEVAPEPDDSLPGELAAALAADGVLRAAFEALTPGRRRGWALQIGGAKTAEGRTSRLEKALPQIRAGRGLHDR